MFFWFLGLLHFLEVEDVLRERGVQLELEDLDPRNLGKACGRHRCKQRKERKE